MSLLCRAHWSTSFSELGSHSRERPGDSGRRSLSVAASRRFDVEEITSIHDTSHDLLVNTVRICLTREEMICIVFQNQTTHTTSAP